MSKYMYTKLTEIHKHDTSEIIYLMVNYIDDSTHII